MEELKNKIRDIPDFPKKGIIFKDIMPLLGDAKAFKKVIDLFTDRYKNEKIDVVVGIEARGFIFATPLACSLNAGFVPVRKPGKLPFSTNNISYELEYGTNNLEIHTDAIKPGQRVLIVDDLLATGGTVSATSKMVKDLKGEVVELAFLVELTFLKGKEKLNGEKYFSLLQY